MPPLKQDQGLLPEDGELIQKTTGTKSGSTTSRVTNRPIFDGETGLCTLEELQSEPEEQQHPAE
jgi:hypothetical protein